ncbi:hypothetical protein [Rhodococcus jostii]|uniref:hypothetical protein n=1 Tax=Rhodococcus jostii TaxID=132919 RepID=UPI0011D15F36|nr:hypothetical protein [Rhodococcus jostii]
MRIWLGGGAFEYQAPEAADKSLIRDWQRKRRCALELVRSAIGRSLPDVRLPNERLFLDP